ECLKESLKHEDRKRMFGWIESSHLSKISFTPVSHLFHNCETPRRFWENKVRKYASSDVKKSHHRMDDRIFFDDGGVSETTVRPCLHNHQI
ncbi:hypothetical protein, partial [Sansalvadorimonas verongulae]|uniref:hypothetical protein n=1 Tax=Sansalvadorimonas verongulae TaxID=2172824 RepID=UPI001E3DD275